MAMCLASDGDLILLYTIALAIHVSSERNLLVHERLGVEYDHSTPATKDLERTFRSVPVVRDRLVPEHVSRKRPRYVLWNFEKGVA